MTTIEKNQETIDKMKKAIKDSQQYLTDPKWSTITFRVESKVKKDWNKLDKTFRNNCLKKEVKRLVKYKNNASNKRQ